MSEARTKSSMSCPRCQAGMDEIVRIEPTLRDQGLIAYECPKCSFIQTSVEKDSLALGDGWIKRELRPVTRSMQKYFNAYVVTGVAIIVVAGAILG